MPSFKGFTEVARLLFVLDVVKRKGPLTCKQICEAMGMTDTRGRHYVAHLRKLGALLDAGMVKPRKFSVMVQTYLVNPHFDPCELNPPPKEECAKAKETQEPKKMRLYDPMPGKKMLTHWVGGNPFAKIFAQGAT